MNSYLFLLPLYNDWDSLLILHEKINEQMKKIKKVGKILIINDFQIMTHQFLKNTIILKRFK